MKWLEGERVGTVEELFGPANFFPYRLSALNVIIYLTSIMDKFLLPLNKNRKLEQLISCCNLIDKL